jgi:HPt (histidine-containing phosphotransfer) domain-containing protein
MNAVKNMITTEDPRDAIVDDVIDRADVLARFEGDAELLQEVADLFLEDCPERMTHVREALARRDCTALQRAAHSLKGSASNFGAASTVQAALRIELLARAGDLAQAEEAYATLEQEATRLTRALAQLTRRKGDGAAADQVGAEA